MSTDVTYYVRADEDRFTRRAPDRDDPWDAGDYGMNLYVNGVYRTRQEGWDVTQIHSSDCIYGFDDITVGEDAYVVVVKYGTGSTFGTDEAWTIAAVVDSMEKAEDAALKCNSDDKNNAYRAWDGYFEHLIYAEVEHFTMG